MACIQAGISGNPNYIKEINNQANFLTVEIPKLCHEMWNFKVSVEARLTDFQVIEQILTLWWSNKYDEWLFMFYVLVYIFL